MPQLKSPAQILKLWKKGTAVYLKAVKAKELEPQEDFLSKKVVKGLERLRVVAAKPDQTTSEEFDKMRDETTTSMNKFRKLFKPKKDKDKVKPFYQKVCRLTLTTEMLRQKQLDTDESDVDDDAVDDLDPTGLDQRDLTPQGLENEKAADQKALEDQKAQQKIMGNVLEDVKKGQKPSEIREARPPSPQVAAKPVVSDDAAVFKKNLLKLMPDIREVQNGDTSVTEEVTQAMAEAKDLATEKRFKEAGAALKKLELLLPTALAEIEAMEAKFEAKGNVLEDIKKGQKPSEIRKAKPLSPQVAAKPYVSDAAIDFKKDLLKLMPGIREAQNADTSVTKEVTQAVVEAKDLATEMRFKEAGAALKKLELLLPTALAEIKAAAAQPPMYDNNGKLSEHGKKLVEAMAKKDAEERDIRRRDFAANAKLDKDKFEKANRNQAYDQLKMLGRGGGGTAFLVESSTDPNAPKVVIKTPNETGDEQERRNAEENMRRELQFYQKVGPHPNIARVYGCGKVGDKKGLIMEPVSGGQVSDLINDLNQQAETGKLSEEKYWGIMQFTLKRTLEALAFINAQGVSHHDIKANNVLIDEATGEPKIIDFDIASDVGEGAFKDKGTEGLTPHDGQGKLDISKALQDQPGDGEEQKMEKQQKRMELLDRPGDSEDQKKAKQGKRAEWLRQNDKADSFSVGGMAYEVRGGNDSTKSDKVFDYWIDNSSILFLRKAEMFSQSDFKALEVLTPFKNENEREACLTQYLAAEKEVSDIDAWLKAKENKDKPQERNVQDLKLRAAKTHVRQLKKRLMTAPGSPPFFKNKDEEALAAQYHALDKEIDETMTWLYAKENTNKTEERKVRDKKKEEAKTRRAQVEKVLQEACAAKCEAAANDVEDAEAWLMNEENKGKPEERKLCEIKLADAKIRKAQAEERLTRGVAGEPKRRVDREKGAGPRGEIGDYAEKKKGYFGASTDYVDFINQLMDPKPDKRLSIADALKHPFLLNRTLDDQEAAQAMQGVIGQRKQIPDAVSAWNKSRTGAHKAVNQGLKVLLQKIKDDAENLRRPQFDGNGRPIPSLEPVPLTEAERRKYISLTLKNTGLKDALDPNTFFGFSSDLSAALKDFEDAAGDTKDEKTWSVKEQEEHVAKMGERRDAALKIIVRYGAQVRAKKQNLAGLGPDLPDVCTPMLNALDDLAAWLRKKAP